MSFNLRILWLLVALTPSFTLALDTSPQFVPGANLRCHGCLTPGVMTKKCGSCKRAFYCSKACQESAWHKHKIWCKHHERLQQQPPVLTEQDWSAPLTGQQIRAEAFKVFSESYKATFGLFATLYTKDTFYDQIASMHKVSAALLYQTLAQVVVENMNAPVKRILLPGIGYLSPLERQAIIKAFNAEEIYGFDIDAAVVDSTVKANPMLDSYVRVADGMVDATWEAYADKNIDLVLFIHPVFCRIENSKKEFNELGQQMLQSVARFLPDSAIVMLNKNRSEVDAIVPAMQELGFDRPCIVDNYERAFPCYSYSLSIVTTMELRNLQELDIAGELTALVNRFPAFIEALRLKGEYRYRFVVIKNNRTP